MITDYHAKYFAYELTRRRRGGKLDRIGQSLFDAAVDLNPHQIDAALFALQNPLSKGVVLADEVGLGKTIEAGLVMAQYWAERQRRLIVVCPAALRKQWARELAEKFNLPSEIVDAKSYNALRKEGIANPFDREVISIISYNYAVKMVDALRSMPWDLVVIDEAHHLRNAHRNSHRTGQAIKEAFGAQKKLLLTATPLQNSLLEIYGLSTVIDKQLFGDRTSFRKQYMRDGGDIQGLRRRMEEFTKRTLRRHVSEYIRYTERHAATFPFTPSDDELRLYHLVSAYMQRLDTYGVPLQNRHLITLVSRKILSSSTPAIIGTLQTIIKRLKKLEKSEQESINWVENLIADEDFDVEWFADESNEDVGEVTDDEPVDLEKLKAEIFELEGYVDFARRILVDAKFKALLSALETGFENMAKIGAERKAVIFTESRRTQEYLLQLLESHGYLGKVIPFTDTSSRSGLNAIYQRWLTEHQGTAEVTGSPAVDKRTAVIDYFRNHAEILIATEAASEGINLQFCSLVINYDLPWNPQRVEQRIGRCHRYGQKHDVVVINFLNQRNAADRRVLELLTEKFQLFDGLFGASDEVLGRIESGVDFERRIGEIYQECRTDAEIQQAFDELQQELEQSISTRVDETREKLLEHFDEQIHELLKVRHKEAERQLDRMQRMFWRITRHQLSNRALFRDDSLSFFLYNPPHSNIPRGDYALVSKEKAKKGHQYLYRLNHPLGEYVLDDARRLDAPVATIRFNLSEHDTKISALSRAQYQRGWLEVNQLELQSFAAEEHIVFTALNEDGEIIDSEFSELLFRLNGTVVQGVPEISAGLQERLDSTVSYQIQAALNKALDENNEYFKRERAKLDAWADDLLLSAEQELEDIKIEIKQAKRDARLAQSLEDQKLAEENIQNLSKLQRRKRREIFAVEDEIEERRDEMIANLGRQMYQKSNTKHLFRIWWELV